MRPPSAIENPMTKLKPLSVANIAALASCYREIDAATKSGGDIITLFVALGSLARALDRINVGHKGTAFSDMTAPTFMREVTRLIPDLIAANTQQMTDFHPAAAEFGQALSKMDEAVG